MSPPVQPQIDVRKLEKILRDHENTIGEMAGIIASLNGKVDALYAYIACLPTVDAVDMARAEAVLDSFRPHGLAAAVGTPRQGYARSQLTSLHTLAKDAQSRA